TMFPVGLPADIHIEQHYSCFLHYYIYLFLNFYVYLLLTKCYLILLLTGWLYVQLFLTIIFLIFGKVDHGHKEKVEQSVFHKNISNVTIFDSCRFQYILAPSIFKTLCEQAYLDFRRSRDSAVNYIYYWFSQLLCSTTPDFYDFFNFDAICWHAISIFMFLEFSVLLQVNFLAVTLTIKFTIFSSKLVIQEKVVLLNKIYIRVFIVFLRVHGDQFILAEASIIIGEETQFPMFMQHGDHTIKLGLS
ncbi:hypothetical protein ACJX0J_020226, partial [Zea mays]